MKTFNERHEVLIINNLRPIQSAKHGEIVKHKKDVAGCEFYRENNLGITKIWLSKDFILDIANQIREIEKQEIDHPFDIFPF